jgi:hypothetical protein
MTMTAEGGSGPAAGLGAIPINAKVLFSYTEKVTGTSKGTGTVNITTDSMQISSSAMGMESVIKIQNGKATMLVNGQPMSIDAAGPRAAQIQQLASTKPRVVKRDPRGIETLVSGNPTSQKSWGDILVLPDHPVQVGETWEHVVTVRADVPAQFGGAPAPDLEMRFSYALKELINKKGRQIAVIEASGSGAMPAASGGLVQGMTQNFSGTANFDVGRGALISGTLNQDTSAKLNMQALAGQAPPAAQGSLPTAMKIEGTTEVKVAEAPVTPAKPAAKKAPVRRARKK